MTAKEMFEKLGYIYEESYYEQKLDEINYFKKGRWTPQIHFSLNNKCVCVYRIYKGEKKQSYFDTKLLKAINKQVEELGWNK